ncbi:PEP-CTERM sorting domain-containing protein [Duganella sp. LX20W]|uniref:PEP-CTERM sorting domain-containing protein n=1 Tax=Rugamonas brunnea TaxID=2758569 RepID=A0A7W2ET01_9BURK|nr:PEP-CTERM sorting domain-containing protein [Rugamonas brunnea]MBA5638078.1 PEP-CTERM sorting domain-containing protein [Rugamonas brunnea]
MLKQLMYGSVLAACCSLAQASAPTQYAFSWTGFDVWEPYSMPYFDATRTVSGTFAGVDANHDNALELNELTDLTINGTEFVHCVDNSGYNTCGVSAFSFSQQGGLQLNAERTIYFSPPGPDEWSASRTTYDIRRGSGNIEDVVFGRMQPPEGRALSFTPQTVTSIHQVSAVPEPQTYAMFGAGLLLLGALTRRRQRN